jgi:hypothetical protein
VLCVVLSFSVSLSLPFVEIVNSLPIVIDITS